MNTCDTCKCNKVCDHDKYGFENCGNYISAGCIEKEKISSYIRENFSIDKTKNADICFAFIDFMNWLDDFCSYGERKENV